MLEIVFFYVLCFTRPRYQVSVYRTIGPLVFHIDLTLAVAMVTENGRLYRLK